MENNVRSEKSINDVRMENSTFESVLDLSKSNTIPNKASHRSKRFKIAQNPIVPATKNEDVKISNASSESCSFRTYSSSASATGSSINLPHFSTYEDSLASHVSSKYNNGSGIELHNKPFTPEFKKNNCDMLQKEHESKPTMSNVEFYSLLEPLQEKIKEASARIQSLIGSKTEADLERQHTYSLFTQFKMQFTPYMEAVENAMEIIPKVLAPTKKYIEIGDTSKKFKISQDAFEKAVSKSKIKDAVLALIECDSFLSKSEKLGTTIGRLSSSTATGKQLKPLDTDMLTALYSLLVNNFPSSKNEKNKEYTVQINKMNLAKITTNDKVKVEDKVKVDDEVKV